MRNLQISEIFKKDDKYRQNSIIDNFFVETSVKAVKTISNALKTLDLFNCALIQHE